jgi:hypothetical protein
VVEVSMTPYPNFFTKADKKLEEIIDHHVRLTSIFNLKQEYNYIIFTLPYFPPILFPTLLQIHSLYLLNC